MSLDAVHHPPAVSTPTGVPSDGAAPAVSGQSAASTPHPTPPPPLPLPHSLSAGPVDPIPSTSADITNPENSIIARHSYPPVAIYDVTADASMTVEGEATMADRTLVEARDEEDDEAERKVRHVKGPSSSSLSLVAREHARKASASSAGHATQHSVDSHVDPLRMDGEARYLDASPLQFAAGEASEGEESRHAPAKVPARRASHLRLDIKQPSSPMPWDVVSPPLDNNLSVLADSYSPMDTGKFRTLQNSSTMPRPLVPKSSYYFGPPPPDSAFGTAPVGQIGVHHPREIIRVERDYTGGELIQFAPIYPLELEGRITPTQFLESINAINEVLISAYSLRHSVLDNMLSLFTLQISRLLKKSHFEKTMDRLRKMIDQMNADLYNPVGLNMLWPQNVAFLYLEIEYY